jgi:hypothetical protein
MEFSHNNSYQNIVQVCKVMMEYLLKRIGTWNICNTTVLFFILAFVHDLSSSKTKKNRGLSIIGKNSSLRKGLLLSFTPDIGKPERLPRSIKNRP